MSSDEAMPDAKLSKPRLVQSTLTNAFRGLKASNTKSPHFGTALNEKDSSNSINLHPSRRANLKGPPPPLPTPKRSHLLAAVAEETQSILPDVLKLTKNVLPTGELLKPDNLYPAPRSTCPAFPMTKVRVLNADTLDAALSLSSVTAGTIAQSSTPPTLILNMANAKHGGGGWLQGALAQEEAICYRSSLSFTLKNRYYPIPQRGAIYSPTVIVLRDSISRGHKLLDLTNPDQLPVVSVVSVAAIRDPSVERALGSGEAFYSNGDDRDMMRSKIRMVLRIAAAKGHRQLVLGALGCGAFGNPRDEVVKLWKEVFTESEFRGGWWKEVVFAVMDDGGGKDSNGNFGIFWRGLDGLEV